MSDNRKAGPFEVGAFRTASNGGVVLIAAEQSWTLTVDEALALRDALEFAADVAEGHAGGDES